MPPPTSQGWLCLRESHVSYQGESQSVALKDQNGLVCIVTNYSLDLSVLLSTRFLYPLSNSYHAIPKHLHHLPNFPGHQQGADNSFLAELQHCLPRELILKKEKKKRKKNQFIYFKDWERQRCLPSIGSLPNGLHRQSLKPEAASWESNSGFPHGWWDPITSVIT